MADINKSKVKSAIYKIIIYALMTTLAFFMLLPFYWSVLTSFRDNSAIFETKLYPTSVTTEHYEFFFENVDVAGTIGNTAFVITMILFFSLLFCCTAGYALAQLDFKGKGLLLKFFYASMMIPGIICLIPQFLVVYALRIDSSLWGIIVPAVASIYGCLFMRSFFLSVPKEIAEAARIDGANEFRIFLLYLPAVLPGLITLGLFTFNAHWNSYLWPNIIVGSDPDMYVLSVAVKEFEIICSDDYGPLMAASVITILPMLVLFTIGQKYFMNNLTFTGVK
jgi:ABC-type sugar transport system, permease component